MVGEQADYAGLVIWIIAAAAFWLCLLRPWWQSRRVWRTSRPHGRRGFEVVTSQTTKSGAGQVREGGGGTNAE
jgi:hypothetical protein